MEKQMKLFTNMTKPLVLFVLLFALGVGQMWGNYAYLDLSGFTQWYEKGESGTVDPDFTVSISSDHCDKVQVNGNSGVWRFSIGDESGTAYFKRRHKDQCNGKWNECSGIVNASQNVMHVTDWNSGEMRTAFVINYIHNTNQIYFDNTNSNFSGNIYFVIGHDYKPNGTSDTYSIAYPMTRVTGTNLYRVVLSSTWEDANFYGVIGSSSDESTVNGDHKWGSSSLSSKGDKGYTAAYQYVFNIEGGVYLCYTSTSGNNQGLTFAYTGTEYTSLPKFNASQAAKKRDTGTEYSDVSGDWPATLKLRGSYMTSSTDTARSTITSTTSEDSGGNKTYGAIRTGEITHTYESISGSYHFEGWGTGDSPSNTDATYSYNITGNTTTYAFFSKLYTLTYERKGDYDTSTVAVYSVDGYSGSKTSGSSIPTGHLITIVATPATGYEVKGWYSDASCETEYEDGEGGVTIEDHNNTFKLASLNANTGVYPKFGPKTYTINLESMDADDDGTTSVDVTYNASTNMTASDAIDKPTKAHYTFDGYWTSENTGTTLDHQLIDADGKWIADKTGYTSNDGEGNPTWVHNYAISLYAKWDEVPYTITMAVSPAGAGTTSPASTATGKLVTESGNITATPAAGYKFKEWQFSKTGEAYDVWCADGYSSTDATIHIKAQHNGTLTAVFEERYSLVGSLYDGPEGGMPGWEDYSKTFTVNSSSPVDLTRTCTLQAGKTYKVQVHDLATSTNLGRSGCDPVCVLEENASLVMENSNNDVFLYTSGAGEYIFKITAVDGSGHPTLTVLRPYPVNFGQKYEDIDGTLHAGTTGGTAAATAGGALTSGDYVTYNTSVTHTATPAGGYTFAGWWSSDAFEGDAFSDTNPMTYAVTSGDNTYAKFVETSTSVTLANDGHGHVEIDDVTKSETTCGVTTTRSLTAVPNAGYKFSSWDKSGDDITLSSTSTNPTTLTGLGSGLDEGQTVTANFTERYSIKGTMNGENWVTTHTLTNIGTNAGSKDTCYVTMTLPANTTYEFAIYDEQTGGWYKASTVAVYNMTYTNHTNWEFGDTKTYNCGITTAGKGTYKFIFNITDTTVTVVYPTSYQVNYGASPSVGGSITVVDGDENAVPNGGYVRSGGSVTYTAAAASGYTFVGWCATDAYGDVFTDINPWTNSSVAATSNAYAKFKSTNFVIYRTGDMEYDPRAAYDDVESFDGGIISEVIEFRMQVSQLDTWYSLCIPFEVNAVKVWDEDDGPAYYDIVPYYRSSGTFYTGHYIIRTPESTTNFPIANFGNWNDPSNPTGYKPAKNTPYIIQWHDGYFSGKYISFFGSTGQTIPSFSAGSAPSSNDVVNVYGNNSMQSGSVTGAYLLDADYGNGAWLRDEDVNASRTVLPFECYILASSATRAKYRAIRPGMTIVDTPTGLDQIINRKSYNRKFIKDGQLFIIRDDKMYNVYGMEVQQ